MAQTVRKQNVLQTEDNRLSKDRNRTMNLEIMDSVICQVLTGMTLEEFIAEAKRRAGKNWNYIGGDDIEAARDWLTVDALTAFSEAETIVADVLYGGAVMVGRMTILEALPMVYEAIKDIKIPDGKLWSK